MVKPAKLHTPSGDEYIQLNQPAARHLFEGIHYYRALLHGIDLKDVGRRSVQNETRDAAEADLIRHQSGTFTIAVLCGGILQLADIGLYLCSRNDIIPVSCKTIASDPSTYARYCVGRNLHGLPLGAYIHAGRNQFAHWGAEKQRDSSDRKKPAGFTQFTQGVFDHLSAAHYEHPFADLVYNLGNSYYGGTPIGASEIMLSVIGWHDYQKYEVDMKEMIGSSDQHGKRPWLSS